MRNSPRAATPVARRAHDLRNAWAEFLGARAWDFEITLTSKHAVGAARLAREFRRMQRRLERISKSPVLWYYVIEHGASGREHIHALLGCDKCLVGDIIASQWRLGHTRVRRYASEHGASYVVKQFGSRQPEHYDISAALPPMASGDRNGVQPGLAATNGSRGGDYGGQGRLSDHHVIINPGSLCGGRDG